MLTVLLVSGHDDTNLFWTMSQKNRFWTQKWIVSPKTVIGPSRTFGMFRRIEIQNIEAADDDNADYDKADDKKGIRDAGSTADIRMLWSAMVCLGLL